MNPTILLSAAHIHEHSGFDLTHILSDTLMHILRMLPLLFVAYLIIEIAEHKASDKLKKALGNKRFGAIGGAVLGLFPECGFSVAAANFYSEKLISAGTLAAVFVATSDEALPVLLSMPETAKTILPVIIIKLLAAVLAGYLLDFIIKLAGNKETHHEHLSESHHHDHHSHTDHSHHVSKEGEHHHCEFCDSDRGILQNSLTRTLFTVLFIFITTFVFHSLVSLIGEQTIKHIMESIRFLQPFVTALVGLIPSCAVSVLLTGLYAEGVLSFGALVAGLCAGAGAGIAVLFKNGRSLKNSLFITGYLWLFGSLVGVIISIFA